MSKKNNVQRGFIRNNVEAFAVAIVMALVIKTFAIEAFQVPTPSMEPSIIGRSPGGDRIIVNKNRYQASDPERYDVVVFRYPLSRMVNYVKRCIGLPGERIRIANGDIFVAKGPGEDFFIARKPIHLVDTIFEANPAIPVEDAESMDPASFRRWWTPDGIQERFRLSGGTLRIEAGSAPAMVRTAKPLTPYRRDPYAPEPRGDPPRGLDMPIGDLRLDISLRVEGEGGPVRLAIRDGTQPSQEFVLTLQAEGGPAASSLAHGATDVTADRLANFRLKRNRDVAVRFENCDDRVRVLVDGEELQTYLYVQAPVDASPHGPPSQVAFGIQAGTLIVHHARVFRDLYYTRYHARSVTYQVPADCFLFFGDNSPNSLDARGWRVSGIRLRESSTVLLGDREAVSDDLKWPRRRSNPFFETELPASPDSILPGPILDEQVHVFLDIHGNSWRLKPGSYDVLDLSAFPHEGVDILDLHGSKLPNPEPAQIALEAVSTARLKEVWSMPPEAASNPLLEGSRLFHYVHRRDLMGQANLVFWPPSRWGVIR